MSGNRILPLDALRGLVMIIMALDHARDFLHVSAITENPTDLATTTPILFFTRWITHLCAPTFVFLAGASAWFARQRLGASLQGYLIRRGIWLIILEFTLVSFSMWFDLRFRTQLFEVIATIGFGLIFLGLLSRVSVSWLGALGLALVFLHDALPLTPVMQLPVVSEIVRPLFFLSPYPITAESMFLVAYPPLSWLGMLLCGYALGPVLSGSQETRRKIMWRAGLASVALFVVLRLINRYGDQPWSQQDDPLFTFLSFINLTKYPPSLQFTLCMLGLSWIILGIIPDKPGPFLSTLGTYGSVPLFYFIIHLYLLHAIMLIVLMFQGFSWSDLNFGMFGQGRPSGQGGLPLWGVYLVWLTVVVCLYPACRWYRALKYRNPGSAILKYT